jgi:hypothetical protein
LLWLGRTELAVPKRKTGNPKERKMPMLKVKLCPVGATEIPAATAKTRQNEMGRKSPARARRKPRSRACNLCGEAFLAPTPYCCFCESCKEHHELYRFHDWLPDQLAVA